MMYIPSKIFKIVSCTLSC